VDFSESRVFPCVVDRTKAVAAQRLISPGKGEYRAETIALAVNALKSQHGKDPEDFDGIAVIFQSPEPGCVGTPNLVAGRPGLWCDIRYVRNEGALAVPHELAHALGLGHSTREGDNVDYGDVWDLMTGREASWAIDPSYGSRGPGLNAWNMRHLGWLDETRVFRLPAQHGYSSSVTLLPLHEVERLGNLAIELPDVTGTGPFLVEYRDPSYWDEGIKWPVVAVRRFETGPFPNSRSYLIKGTKGQHALSVGDMLSIGTHPRVEVTIDELNTVNRFAAVTVSYFATPSAPRAVRIVAADSGSYCNPTNIEGHLTFLTFELESAFGLNYSEKWKGDQISTVGSLPQGTGQVIGVVMPAAGTKTEVSLTVTFEDGIVVSDTIEIQSISAAEADWRHLTCALLSERRLPEPWWEWDPARARRVVAQVPLSNRGQLRERLAHLNRLLGEGADEP
jgi:hypothetical protein